MAAWAGAMAVGVGPQYRVDQRCDLVHHPHPRPTAHGPPHGRDRNHGKTGTS